MSAEQLRIIRWEEPPPARGNVSPGRLPGSKYDGVAAELRSNPGRWARIQNARSRNVADALTARIRSGQIQCFGLRGDFDACARTVGGTHRVYARYVGDGGES